MSYASLPLRALLTLLGEPESSPFRFSRNTSALFPSETLRLILRHAVIGVIMRRSVANPKLLAYRVWQKKKLKHDLDGL